MPYWTIVNSQRIAAYFSGGGHCAYWTIVNSQRIAAYFSGGGHCALLDHSKQSKDSCLFLRRGTLWPTGP